MKNKKNNMISETNSAGMPSGYGRDMSGRGVNDATGRSDMIAQPVNTAGVPVVSASMSAQGVPATYRTAPGTHATAAYTDIANDNDEDTATLSNAQEGEEEETDEAIETNEELKAEFHDALISLLGEDVSPSLINQLEAIFEAAVTDRVESKVAKILKNVDGNVKNYLDNVTESLVEKVDDYLDYVVEEWMTDNAVAVEQGVKTQIAENFISGLKNLFENHYIDVPAEKYNVLDELYASNRELEARLNEAVKYNMNLKKEVSLTECAGIFVAETRELADTQIVKLQNLMENVAFTNPEEYREKLVAIRENYLTRSRPISSRNIEPEQTFVPVKQTSTNLVENYAGALGRLNKKV
jgi:hypothetical protein